MPTLDVTLTTPAGVTPGRLSTDHATSSYGLPVLLVDGTPYGSGDLHRLGTPLTITATPTTEPERRLADAAQRAGYPITLA